MTKGTINKVIILGRLGQAPEIKATQSGTQVANLNIATNELGPKDQMGQRTDVTEWHRVVLFGKTAEVAAQYLDKGSLVYIEGRLQTRKWQDQNGADRWTTEIIGYELQMIGSKPENTQQPMQQVQQTQQNAMQNNNLQTQQQGGYVQQAQPANNQPQGFSDFDDEIPFR